MYDVDKIGIVTKAYGGPTLHYKEQMTKTANHKYPDAATGVKVINVAQPTWVGTVNQDNEYECQQWCRELDFCNAVTWDTKKKECGVHELVSKTTTASTGFNFYKKSLVTVPSLDKAAYLNEAMIGVLRSFSTAAAYKDHGWFPCYQKKTFTAPGDILGAHCPKGAFGQFIIVEKNGANSADGPLALCEVEVFGRKTNNKTPISSNHTAQQVSTKSGNVASRAVDGKFTATMGSGSCSQTAGTENNEWWTIDLARGHNVTNVQIVARGDCCASDLTEFTILTSATFSDAEISTVYSRAVNVSVSPLIPPGSATGFKYSICQASVQVALKDGQSFMVDCEPGAVGRHLTIVKHKSKAKPLELCEVEIYGVAVP
ncbi:uncharacterized protein LOC135497754 [Lineus longissimus]